MDPRSRSSVSSIHELDGPKHVLEGQPAKLLEVCLDSSDVKVVNVAGTQMNPTGKPRSLNIFTLIEDNGAWKIASQDFPNNADC